MRRHLFDRKLEGSEWQLIAVGMFKRLDGKQERKTGGISERQWKETYMAMLHKVVGLAIRLVVKDDCSPRIGDPTVILPPEAGKIV